ncbi:hypothetical protein [Xanthomonas phage BUDD]|nr:hypothetical protein [Xanthomonas phage BUDD]
MYTYHKDGTQAAADEIFVFGSNLAGRHGAGAAKAALQHYGARYGEGTGAQGRSYAIPTKDENIQTLPIEEIKPYIDEFIKTASHLFNTQKYFVTRIGCGLAGYTDEQIAPLFRDAPYSCMSFPEEWKPYLED